MSNDKIIKYKIVIATMVIFAALLIAIIWGQHMPSIEYSPTTPDNTSTDYCLTWLDIPGVSQDTGYEYNFTTHTWSLIDTPIITQLPENSYDLYSWNNTTKSWDLEWHDVFGLY